MPINTPYHLVWREVCFARIIPLADRRLAAVGHVARGGAAAASTAKHRGGHLTEGSYTWT